MAVNCDSTTSPADKFLNAPAVNQLSVNPQENIFDPSDGFKDTTLNISIEASIENVDEGIIPGYVIRNKFSSALVTTGELSNPAGTNNFTANANIETSTTSFEEYIVEVFAYNTLGSGNFFQSTLKVQGFSNNRPEITESSSPGTINRPSSGSIPAIFTATVTDQDGDNTIDRVLIRVIDQTAGEVEGSPFNMFDDGSTLRDETANDFTFTWSQNITPTDGVQDRDFNIEFFAIDKGGLISDTVRTTFSIRGNQ